MEAKIKEIIRRALDEDIQSGDVTTQAVIPDSVLGNGKFLVKAIGVIAGLSVTKNVFEMVDDEIGFKVLIPDGGKVKVGDIVAEVEGKASSILTAERTALNFLQRMSGIATLTNDFVEKIKHTKAKILDTRKTVPQLRLLDKEAVKLGGGKNHRIGLFDMFLIKDNHIEIAGSITNAVNAGRNFQQKNNSNLKIEVETKNLVDVSEALSCNVEIIMLDNFDTDLMRKAVELINGKCLVEASGNINIDNVKEVAETGVDFISVGALTHSVKALDISLEIELIK
ncbi:MAG TPA: carboxylating nicotinate-nucleotide diphosphorylase [Ignavibacteriaceae bacterium]|nr:carboxylating nicotinate-nucleotide diphosphorylase [Ignavibacteriaceae bacterium]